MTSRTPLAASDYQAVRTMLQSVYAADGPPDYCTVGDLDWWRATDDDPTAFERARIWLDAAGDVVGFAWPNGDRLDHVTLPDYRDLEPEMLAWAEEQIRTAGTSSSMTAFAFERHQWRYDYLAKAGFERGQPSLRYWHRRLDDLPPVLLPEGYVIRPLRGDHELPERVEAHREAFAPSKMTVVKHHAAMASPTYRADLDLVVEAPDGRIAAYCIVWLDDANANGVFEPVGCRTAFRQRGLTRALMTGGMHRLRDLGARTAVVVSHPTEVAANRLYASAGFSAIDLNVDWVKQLA